MFIPRGFGENFITTKLGKMVYYTAQGEPWDKQTSKEKLVFLHGFGGGSSAKAKKSGGEKDRDKFSTGDRALQLIQPKILKSFRRQFRIANTNL